MIREAIILAGGLGTRLREVMTDVPKSMAPVHGRPFLGFIIDYLRMQGIEQFIFSLGYKAEYIKEYLAGYYPTLAYQSIIENEPLGTGGAIQNSLNEASEQDVLVMNGDTLFKINCTSFFDFHKDRSSECTLALKPLQNIERYGLVQIDAKGCILSFTEKKFYEQGLINGGVYIINKASFLKRNLPEKFSFEKDYLECLTGEGKFYGLIQNGYFIDIGIPADFKKASSDLLNNLTDLKNIDGEWTLFLDRDGVINNELPGNYVVNPDLFVFSPGVLKAFAILKERFKRIIVVSNQRGVGKGLMSLSDLQKVHTKMQEEIRENGGRIDKLYYCTDTDDRCFQRKPNPGMAVQAIKDFPDIDLAKSIMVGNKAGDMRFGRSAGMHTVFVKTTNPDQPFPHPDIDYCFESLLEFAQALES